MELEGTSGDGRASVWVSGNQQPLRVRPGAGAGGGSAAVTEAATFEALKAAYDRSTATMKERMEEAHRRLSLPGLGGMSSLGASSRSRSWASPCCDRRRRD